MTDTAPTPNPQDPYGSFIAFANWAKNIVGQTNANIEAVKAGGNVSTGLGDSISALQAATTGLSPIVDVVHQQSGDATANWYQGALGSIQNAAGALSSQVGGFGTPDPTAMQASADQIAGLLQQIIASSAVAGAAEAAGASGSAATQAQAQQAAADAAARANAALESAAAAAAAAASYATPGQTTPVSTTPVTSGTAVPGLPPVAAGTTPPPVPVARTSPSNLTPWIVGGAGVAVLGWLLLRGSR